MHWGFNMPQNEQTVKAAEWVPIGDLTPWDRNPRRNDHAVDEVARSIERFGWGAVIIARKADNVVIAGHTRLKAAQKLGMDKVPVRWLDLDPAEAAALALADNKVGELADWDNDVLSEVLRALESDGADLDGLGFSAEELDALLGGPEELPGSEGEDDVPEVQEDPDSVPGGVYELGPHRLVCGDSTDPGAWSAAMPDGEVGAAMWTDPPYGVSYVGGTAEALTIANDSLNPEELESFLGAALGEANDRLAPGAVVYVAAPSGNLFAVFGTVLAAMDLWRHTLVWVKDRFVLGRCDYHYRHESIFYGWKPGGAHAWSSGRDKDSVLEVKRPSANRDHPTMKPVELIVRCLDNHPLKGGIVIEPFGGSGSTMIAAAQVGARARLIELDPRYCDVIRRRWTRYALKHGLDVGPGGLED